MLGGAYSNARICISNGSSLCYYFSLDLLESKATGTLLLSEPEDAQSTSGRPVNNLDEETCLKEIPVFTGFPIIYIVVF